MGVAPHPIGVVRVRPPRGPTGPGGPTVAPMSPRPGHHPFEITAGAAVKLGFFAALGATMFSLALTVVAGAIGVLLAFLFGTSLLGLLNR